QTAEYTTKTDNRSLHDALPILVETIGPLTEQDLENNSELQEVFGKKFRVIYSSETIKHVLSHQNIHARFLEIINIEGKLIKNRNCNYVLIKGIDKLAKSKLTVSFCEKYVINLN